jgi:hypothetical protein
MAYPTGVSFQHMGLAMGLQPIGETSTTQNHVLGLVVEAKDVTYGPGKFIYCKGVASTAKGDLCTYDTVNGDTARAVNGGSTSTGPCGVAMSANVASQYGWYQIEGAGPVAAGTVAADAPLYLTSTAGTVDDAVVAGDLVSGLVARSVTASGFATCQIDHPSISGGGGISAPTYGALTGILKVTLTAEAENTGANTIEVEGQVSDILGVAVASAKEVLVRSLAVTANEGDLSIGAGANPGTLIKAFAPAAGVNEAWIATTAAGHFRFIVTNAAAETNLVQVTVPGGITAVLKLTFA